MDAKRMVPILQLRAGRVEAAGHGAAEGACRLELAGADEVIFLDEGAAAPARAEWLLETARTLFIPFSVGCAFERMGEALAAGADKVILEVGPGQLPALTQAAQEHGRPRLMVAVSLAATAEGGWKALPPGAPEGREAFAWMAELAHAGAGELLVSAEGDAVAALGQRLAQLPVPALFRCADATVGGEALAHGADGLAFPGELATANQLKTALGGHGLAFRN